MSAFPFLMNCGDGGLRACRSGLSGVLEDLYGFLSTSDFQQTEKTEARDKTDALLSYIAAS